MSSTLIFGKARNPDGSKCSCCGQTLSSCSCYYCAGCGKCLAHSSCSCTKSDKKSNFSMVEKLKNFTLAFLLVFGSAQAQVKVQSSTGATSNTYNITNSGDNLTLTSGANMAIHNRVFLSAARYSNDLGAAISAATSRGYGIKVDTVVTYSGRQTVPSNVALIIERNGSITLGSLLTINGPFQCGLSTAFTGNLDSVSFSQTSVGGVLPEWFGARADSSTASGTAWKVAVKAQLGHKTVISQPGIYKVNDKITIFSNTRILGNHTTLVSSDTSDYVFSAGSITSITKNISLEGLTIRLYPQPGVRSPNTSAIYFVRIDTLLIQNCRILGRAKGMGIQLSAVRNAKILFNHVEDALGDGIHVSNGTNTDPGTGQNIRSENVQIIGNTVRNCGDDKIAVSGYSKPLSLSHPAYSAWNGSQLVNRKIIIADNIVEGGNSHYNSRGISVIGAEDVLVVNNSIKGFTGGKMTSGIFIGRIPDTDGTGGEGFRNNRVRVQNNIIEGGQFSSFIDDTGGIRIHGSDSVDVIGNTINWDANSFGIRVKVDTNDASYGYTNSVNDLFIANNRIQNARTALSFLTVTETGERINRVIIDNNIITQSRIGVLAADTLRNLTFTNNRCFEINWSGTAATTAVRVRRPGQLMVFKDNIFWSGSSVQTVIGASVSPETGANAVNFQESGNVFEVTATGDKVGIPYTGNKYFSQREFRTHYLDDDSTTYPQSGTWTKGDVALKTNFSESDSGSFLGWVKAGISGTWFEFGSLSKSASKEYGSLLLKADTISIGTSFARFNSVENRPRSSETVSWALDSLTITHEGRYRITGGVTVAAADSNVSVALGISFGNATPDNAHQAEQWLNDASKFGNLFITSFDQLANGKSVKLKIKRNSGTANLYIKRGWLTVERLN